MNLRFEEEKKKERRIQLIKESVYFAIAVVIVIVLAWAIVHFALKRVSVIGSSMENTLYNGEDVIVNKTSYAILSPDRNDVIAFYPIQEEDDITLQDDSSIIIRRIIGLPEEKVRIQDGFVYINGQKLEEEYPFEVMNSAGQAISEITLGEDEYFVLSDNRRDMDDSRSTSFTKVKRENIIGEVILSLNPFSLVGGPENEEEEKS